MPRQTILEYILYLGFFEMVLHVFYGSSKKFTKFAVITGDTHGPRVISLSHSAMCITGDTHGIFTKINVKRT